MAGLPVFSWPLTLHRTSPGFLSRLSQTSPFLYVCLPYLIAVAETLSPACR